MGYTIQYGPSGKAETAWRGRRKKKTRIRISLVLLAAVCAFGVLAGGVEKVWEFLIPGDPEITKAAFMQFTEDIRQGGSVGEAITAFCREIIDNAEIVQ